MHFKTVLAHLKSTVFSVGQPWWLTFFHIETCQTHIFVMGPPLGLSAYGLYEDLHKCQTYRIRKTFIFFITPFVSIAFP